MIEIFAFLLKFNEAIRVIISQSTYNYVARPCKAEAMSLLPVYGHKIECILCRPTLYSHNDRRKQD